MTQNKKIGIVLVNYNGATFQNECVRTIIKQTYKNYLIIVVDSGSTDNSIEKLKREFGDLVTVLRQKENCGVAKGNNIGIKYSISEGCDYILLLNNDTEIESSMIEKLMNHADYQTAVVPKIYYYDDPKMLWLAGGVMDWKRGNAYHIGNREYDHGQYDKIESISYAPTCAMLINKNIFNKIGYEDEELFMYWDDTDLCVRMIDGGFKIKYIPDAKMWHKVSSSSGGSKSKLIVYYVNRNQLYFLKKYRKKIKFFTLIKVYLKGFCKILLSPIRNPNEKHILEAYMDYWHGIMGRKV